VDCMRATFDATGDVHPEGPTEIHIGDSVVMVSGIGEREAFPAFPYAYVEDPDTAYSRAIDAGAITLDKPLDTSHGDWCAMVQDAASNI
jgi:PhnB protein